MGIPGSSVVKKKIHLPSRRHSLSGSRRCPGEGNGNTLQHSCRGYPVDGGAWRAKVPGAAKELDMTYQLNNNNINNNKTQFLFKAYRILGDNLYQPLKVLYEKKVPICSLQIS